MWPKRFYIGLCCDHCACMDQVGFQQMLELLSVRFYSAIRALHFDAYPMDAALYEEIDLLPIVSAEKRNAWEAWHVGDSFQELYIDCILVHSAAIGMSIEAFAMIQS